MKNQAWNTDDSDSDIGAVTALSLLTSENRPKNVVMLEAREACSGASGRNAGHCRPDAYRGFTAFSRKHGEQDALEILQSERTVYEL
jgi:glycine/D-amino acid oxidase-like deaminating enzyme